MAAPHALDWKISLPKYKKALKTTPATNGNQFQLRNLHKDASNYNNLHSPSKRTQSHPSRGNPVIFSSLKKFVPIFLLMTILF